MKPENVVDDSLVYAVFNSVFTGQNSQIRNLPAIKKLVEKHQGKPRVAQILKEYGAPAVCNRIRGLLGDGIFESTVNAKCRFPELFEVSRARSAERAVSEAKTAAGHSKAVEDAIAADGRADPPNDSDYESGEPGAAHPRSLVRLPLKQEISHLGMSFPSLFPLEFPFLTSYKILVKTQEILERACFRFTEKAMPDILEERQWHCPESSELNLWTVEFSKRLSRFENLPSGDCPPSKPLKQLFPSIAQIRHHAVHRIPVTAKKLEDFMADGETLALVFKDSAATSAMSRAKCEVQKAAAEMDNRKSMLEARLSQTLRQIADQRAELDRWEGEAIADMQREDGEYQLFAGAHLEQTIWSDDTAVREALSEPETLSDNEMVKDRLVDGVGTVIKSDMAPHGDSKAKDVVEESPSASVMAKSLTGILMELIFEWRLSRLRRNS